MSRRRIARAAAAGSFWRITPPQTATRSIERFTVARVMPPMQKNGIPSRFAYARYRKPSGRSPGLRSVAYIGPTEM